MSSRIWGLTLSLGLSFLCSCTIGGLSLIVPEFELHHFLHAEFPELLYIVFGFLAFLFGRVVQSTRLEYRHWWMPVSVQHGAHDILCWNGLDLDAYKWGFKYQIWCHNLVLGLVTKKLKCLKLNNTDSDVHYQFIRTLRGIILFCSRSEPFAFCSSWLLST